MTTVTNLLTLRCVECINKRCNILISNHFPVHIIFKHDVWMPLACVVHHLPCSVQPRRAYRNGGVYICTFGLWNIVEERMLHQHVNWINGIFITGHTNWQWWCCAHEDASSFVKLFMLEHLCAFIVLLSHG